MRATGSFANTTASPARSFGNTRFPSSTSKRKGGHGPEAFGNSVYGAVRLKNGNTLIATGNGHSVLEVTPDKKIAWAIHQKDLPGITLKLG